MPNQGYKKASNKQDYKTTILQIRLSPGDKIALQQIASERGISVSDLVRTLLPMPAQPESSPKPEEGPKEITLPGYPGTFTIKE